MSLVEVMIAVVILTVAVYLLSSTITATIAHTGGKRERAIAVEAAMNLFEIMRSEPFDELYFLYNDDPADDPQGVGTADGKYFAVEGLERIDGSPVGMIIMPSDGAELREDGVSAKLNMPRDLDGDLQIDDQDHSEDYIVLPLTVRIEWDGKAGRRKFEMSTMLADLKKL